MAKARLVPVTKEQAQAGVLRALGTRVSRLAQSLKTPTFPVYPSDPADPVETQVAFFGDTPKYYRDGAWHEFGGAGAAGGTLDSFALVGGTFSFNTEDNFVLDNATVASSMNWGGDTAGTSFDYDATAGRARILRPGLYQVAMFANVEISGIPAADTTFIIELEFGGFAGAGVGFGLEPPGGTPTPSSPLWTVEFPAGTSDSFEASLQRIRPISVTSFTTFPLEIRPRLTLVNPGAESATVRWLALWGFRISDPPGSYMSD